GVLLADGHQARHLVLGDVDFLAPPVGERQVGNLEIGICSGFYDGVHWLVSPVIHWSRFRNGTRKPAEPDSAWRVDHVGDLQRPSAGEGRLLYRLFAMKGYIR